MVFEYNMYLSSGVIIFYILFSILYSDAERIIFKLGEENQNTIVKVNNANNNIKIDDITISSSHRSCDPYDICSNNDTSSRINYERYSSTDYRHDYNCMCDKMCSEFKDCCNTSVYYNKEEQKEPISYKCHSPKRYDQKIYIKNACSKSWHDTIIAKKCSMSSDGKMAPQNLDLTTPVSSRTTNITYGNVYCALCNFDKDYIYWDVVIACRHDESLFASGIRITDNDDLNLLVNISICNLIPQVPKNVTLYHCEDIEIIDTCPDSWTDKETIKLCEDFIFLVREPLWKQMRFQYYRNQYCAYCNGVPDTNLQCYLKSRMIIPRSGFDRIYVSKERHESSGIYVFFDWYTTVAICCSLFFLVCHLIVFSFVKRMQTLGGKNLTSFCVALILVYGNFLISDYVEGNACVLVAIFMYYSFLVAFSSMLTMSFDIWKTFWNTTRKLRAVSQKQNLRFFAYSICNWILPILPVLFSVYLQFSDSALSPKFGEEGCWLRSSSLFVFFSLPTFLITSLNFAFFVHTLYMIRTNQCSSANQKTLVDFKLYARLALFTGTTWIIGIFLTYFPYNWVRFVFIFLNATQGVFIFCAFTCKKKNFAEFLISIGILKKSDLASKSTNGLTLTTTIHTVSDVSDS